MADALSAPAASPVDGEPYQSLYRRYRPQRFEDVKGQEQVTRPLRNAVRDDRVGHAYLFSGPRGTGKTSTARILAMALNCAHPVDGEPDGTCPSCVGIRGGSSFDVQELDAASNRKLDEMRDLLSRVALGTSGRWKVYIVDEVHQLTADAASALLKTLEEPPAHVVFVLATTDPQKVLPTIRSRTQHYEFRLLGPDVLGGLLRDVNERAALGLAPEAIDLVVRRGHGSARDALSVLDQVAAAGDVEDETEVVGSIVEAVADRDAGRVLTAMAEAMSAGRDPRRLATDLLERLRNGFLATQARSLVMLPDDAAVEVEQQSRRLGLAGVVKALEVVGQAAVDMRDSVDPRVTLEVALVRLAAPKADESTGALMRRLEQLEAQVEALTSSGGTLSVVAPGGTAATPGGARTGATTATPPPRPASAAPSSPGPTTSVGGPAPVSDGPAPVADGPAPRSEAPRAPQVGLTPAAGAPSTVEPTPLRTPSHAGVDAGQDGAATVGSSPPPGLTGRSPRRAVAPANPGVGAPPPQPGRSSRPALSSPTDQASAAASTASRSALGAHRRGAPPGPASPGAASPGAAAPASARSGHASHSEPPESGSGGDGSGGGDADPRGAEGTGSLPSRDELTKAWGDEILPTLRTAVKAYVSAGRFVEVDGRAAVYALADRGLLARAQPLAGEIEAALTAHFGRTVPVRLVLDGESAPVVAAPPPPQPDEEDPSSYDLADLEDAGPAVVSPEQRLLEAFPGAEEVTP